MHKIGLALCLGLSVTACRTLEPAARGAETETTVPAAETLLPAEFDLPAPNPAPKTLSEALAHLPFQPELQSDHVLGGSGTVTAQQIIQAAARVGVELRPEEVRIQGAPAVPTRQPAEFGFRAVVSAPQTAQSGQPYRYDVQLFNTTDRQRDFIYGAATLELVISKNGQPLRWANGMVTIAIGYELHCPAQQLCQGDLSGQVSLNRFNPRLKLPPGQYDVTFFLTGLGAPYASPSHEGIPPLLLSRTSLTVTPAN